MKDKHVENELSAYLDGQCADPGHVARHIEQCPSCAQRFVELKRLFEQLRRLPAPETGSLFTARVMNAVKCLAYLPEPERRRWFGVPLVVVAAACLLVAVSGWFTLQVLRQGEPPNAPGVQVGALPNDGEANAWAHDGDVAIPWDDPGLLPEAVPDDEPGEEAWLDALAHDAWFVAMADSLDETADMDALVEGLEDNEAAMLKELLQEYAG